MNRDQIAQKLYDYFCFNTKDGTYIYNLTRIKEAFNIGTMTLDDFEEIDDDFIYDLAEFILNIMSKEEIKINKKYSELEGRLCAEAVCDESDCECLNCKEPGSEECKLCFRYGCPKYPNNYPK